MTGSKNWEEARADFDTIAREQGISGQDFRPLGIHEGWAAIEEKIYARFCRLDHPTVRPIWLWEYFKLTTACLPVEFPFDILEKLIDPEEEIWFFMNGDRDKFWFYEGKVKAINTMITEGSYIDEVYLASKKYEWLLCINHHDTLIVTGESMAHKLKALAPEAILQTGQ